MERSTKLSTAIAISSLLISGCAFNNAGGHAYSTNPGEYKPLFAGFGKKVQAHQYRSYPQQVVNGNYRKPHVVSSVRSKDDLVDQLTILKALNKEKDKEVRDLRSQVEKLSKQLDSLLVMTKKQLEASNALVANKPDS